jgi:SAM-dependent methyltransferase
MGGMLRPAMEPGFYRETFDAEDWDWWHVGRRRILARVLRRGLAQAGLPATGLDLLDVGCGPGGTTAFLGRGHRVVGCELDPAAAEMARRRGLDVVRASAEALPFRDAGFDAALCLDVLEHHADDAAVARETRRVLRPNGVLLATVPCFELLWGPHDVLSHHLRRYVLPALRRMLTSSGFRVLRSSYFNALLFPAAAAVQLARRAMRRGAAARAASDLPKRPSLANALLRETFAAEGPWVSRLPLPFGISAFALAQAEP